MSCLLQIVLRLKTSVTGLALAVITVSAADKAASFREADGENSLSLTY